MAILLPVCHAIFMRKSLFILFYCSICCVTLTAHAATYEITGTIEEADGLAAVFFSPGEAVLGIIEADDAAIASGLITFSDLAYVEINYGQICLSNTGCSFAVGPISSGSAAISVNSSGVVTGGFFNVISMGPTDLNVYLFFDFDTLTVQLDICGLGCQNLLGTSLASIQVTRPVPLPASMWLFISSLLVIQGQFTYIAKNQLNRIKF